MAFRKNGWMSWAAGIATALAARTAEAQIYSQLPAQTAPAGNQQPAYPQYPNQQSPGPGYQTPQNMRSAKRRLNTRLHRTSRFPASNTRRPPRHAFKARRDNTAPPRRAKRRPASIRRRSISFNPAPIRRRRINRARIRSIKRRRIRTAQQPNNYRAPNGYGSLPNGYGAHEFAASAAPSQRMQQAPGVASYPEQYRAPVAARGGVRPAQFEQPIDQQQQQPARRPAGRAAGEPDDPPGFRATEVSTASSLPNTVPSAVAGEQTPQEHPLMPALRWAKQGLAEFTKVQDYSCTLVKHERIDGTLGEHEYIFVKVRHQPFSVYTYFLGPARVKGQEAIFVDGSNDDSLLAHGNGIKHA